MNKKETKKYNKIYYINNLVHIKKQAVEYQKKHREQIKKYNQRRYKRVIQEAKYVKKNLVFNGCAICGYDKCSAALDFHHVNPGNKKFSLNLTNIKYKTDKELTKEVAKCVLLCANCHREIHHKEE